MCRASANATPGKLVAFGDFTQKLVAFGEIQHVFKSPAVAFEEFRHLADQPIV
jgi:hypothetical protein